MKVRINLPSIAIGLAVGALAAGGITYAATESTGTTINACRTKTTGALRVLATGTCKSTEVPLSWNSQGPQGAPGSPGMQGAKGDRGDTGAIGPQGRPGQDAGRCSVISGTQNRGMQWWSCNFDGQSFRYAALSQAALSGSSAVKADFTRASLDGADLLGMDATGASFRKASFDANTRFSQAVLDFADFSGTRISGYFTNTSFRNANLNGATLSGRVEDTSENVGIDFDGADLRNLKFDDMTMVKPNFRGALMDGLSFSGASLYKADLTKVSLPASSFSGMRNGGESNFSGLNLSAVNWTPSQLVNSPWEGIVFKYTPWFGNANFSGANLSNARLTGVSLSGSNVQGTDFTGAVFSEQVCDDSTVGYNGNGWYGRQCRTPSTQDLKNSLCGLIGTPAALPSGWRIEDGCIRNW